MKKFLKPIIYISVCILLFAGGFRSYGKVGFPKEIEEIRKEEEARIMTRKESWDSGTEPSWRLLDRGEFLDEHLLGVWQFEERIIPLEEDYDGSINFTGQGLEEMKGISIAFYRRPTMVRFEDYDANSFSDPKDAFLFWMYAGYDTVKEFAYYIDEEVDESRLGLRHIISQDGEYEEYEAAFPEDCELVHVTYNLSFDKEENPVLLPETYPVASVYIDPEDDETIYVDFCGLWKMKRGSWMKDFMPNTVIGKG